MCPAALNMAVFLLIGKTSALTMNIAGVIKDWLLIGLSVLLFKSPVTSINLGGCESLLLLLSHRAAYAQSFIMVRR